MDYLGNQFWSDVYTVPATLSGNLDIPHQDVVITVQDDYGGAQNPLEGVKVYLFTSSGSYMGKNQATDINGQVTFNLPENTYKVRADYMGQQYWSSNFTWQDSSITISKGTAHIHVTRIWMGQLYIFSLAQGRTWDSLKQPTHQEQSILLSRQVLINSGLMKAEINAGVAKQQSSLSSRLEFRWKWNQWE